MRARSLLLALSVPALVACSHVETYGGPVAGVVGTRAVLASLDLWSTTYLSNGLIAYAIYDPLQPTWTIEASVTGEDRVQMDLQMKRLVTGGEGEARQVFMRTARKLVEEGGYAGYDVLRFEEGVEATRPFARRIANGEIRLVKSRQFPTL
ncbi:MAG: hypothetical protein CVU19_06920 [Betaproteobacteria bacterium HGW-Betaproteobacteria-13]|jgi:hypothetical protein|uniref:Uncharacterized protein n=1 Tax=Parazoarcus communis TaxID=41977 RepID=A0A2U8H3Z2_9RHOO|nr:hypothetical protein [Parazoarcus communis]AWI80343.1 hypothetical protein CEW87_13830 [Parazoarcus communis]PKO59617.1 MAG: hypothetical protein CVU25_01725 [Betaproteobacteria bacterium HGW-Betaproteobacteria-19]PKO81464.1 MAG: hypothetical protein CVU19_06920 [Betaproteobacteria bacterium HGW-Betaproteobacteria-13]